MYSYVSPSHRSGDTYKYMSPPLPHRHTPIRTLSSTGLCVKFSP